MFVIKILCLLLVVLTWFFVPHYLSGVQFLVGMVVLDVLCVVLFSALNHRKRNCSLSVSGIKALKTLSMFSSAAIFIVLMLLILLGSNKFRLLALYMVLASSVNIIFIYGVFAGIGDSLDNEMYFGSRPIMFGGIDLVISLTIIRRITHISDDWRFIVISLALGIGLGCYYQGQVPIKGRRFGTLWLSCLCAALLLTYSLNVLQDTSGKELVSYTAGECYKYSTTCKLEDGSSFGYIGCPFEEGEQGYIYECDGWFQIRHFIPIGE